MADDQNRKISWGKRLLDLFHPVLIAVMLLLAASGVDEIQGMSADVVVVYVLGLSSGAVLALAFFPRWVAKRIQAMKSQQVQESAATAPSGLPSGISMELARLVEKSREGNTEDIAKLWETLYGEPMDWSRDIVDVMNEIGVALNAISAFSGGDDSQKDET